MIAYVDVAESSWRWVQDQVNRSDGLAVPESVPGDFAPREFRNAMHSGVGGLAYALAEIRLTRRWTTEEQHLADAVAEQTRADLPTQTDATFFNGLVSAIGVLLLLDAPGADTAVARLSDLATPDGWDFGWEDPRYLPGARIHDAVLGTAGVLLGAVWAHRHHVEGAAELAAKAADILIAEAHEAPTGLNWHHVPLRYRATEPVQAPNYSHGIAGIATALALAGTELDRPDLVEAAHRGAQHLITLGRTDDGFKVPLLVPPQPEEKFSYGWCHGPTGTSLLFLALHHAGVENMLPWHRKCLHAVRTSGLPARLHPGFWDNDGRCCGTAGVGEFFLDAYQRDHRRQDLDFATTLADGLVERAIDKSYWRFVEHKAADPLLPPGVGWMQGAAGISAHLFRVARVLETGPDAQTVPTMADWWVHAPSRS